MSDSRMKYLYKVPYDRIDLMLGSLKPGKYYKAWAAIMQYAHATETGDLDVPVPVTGDPSIDGFVRVMCNDVRDKTKANFEKVFPANKRNAETRWSNEAEAKADHVKGKRKGKAKQDKAEAEAGEAKQGAPMTFEEFEAFAEGHDVRQLYDKLQGMGWVYHGHQLSEYWTKCNKCYERHGSKYCCGLYAVVAYNTDRGRNEPLRAAVFNALCDMAAVSGRDLCDVGAILASTRTTDDRIVYARETFDSIEKYIDSFKTSEN